MEIHTIEIAGFAGALNALRLPFGKEERSLISTYSDIARKGEIDKLDGLEYEHNECSYSTSIRIDDRDLALMETLVKRGDEHAKVVRGIVVYAKITAPVYWWCELETYRAGHERLASESTMHIDCKGLAGKELQEAKANIPMGKELTKVDLYSYQALRKMVAQRHDHRLPEWRYFVKWVESLPYAKELILAGLDY